MRRGMLISGHVRALIFGIVTGLSVFVLAGKHIPLFYFFGVPWYYWTAAAAFSIDEMLQKIYMVGKEDERSPLVMEIIFYVAFIVPIIVISLKGL